MNVSGIALLLGVVEREAEGGKRGWSAVDLVVTGENASRRIFIEQADTKLLAASRSLAAAPWGSEVTFRGNLDQRGRLSLTSLERKTGGG